LVSEKALTESMRGNTGKIGEEFGRKIVDN
jgi:hypothetical protein